MSKHANPDNAIDIEYWRSFDPERGSFDPPEHPSLRDPQTNPSGVRHIAETAQDQLVVEDRPRYQAALSRRARLVAAATKAKQRLRGMPGNRALRGGPPHAKA